MRPVVQVSHGSGSYPVFVGAGILGDLALHAERSLPGRRLAVITDRTVAGAVPHRLPVPTLVVPPGEGSKTRSRWGALTDRLLELGYGRDAALVAVGGGMVGDLAGFVAATFQRGIPWLQVPTSLLAMVDASVGGKTGVNTPRGKNLVGAFHPPVAVLADPTVLGTLSTPHLAAGLVEAVKHGVVADAGYFSWIDRNVEQLLGRDFERLSELVSRSVEIKAEVVSEDEREAGRRAILNAGHTIGHAIEQVTAYAVPHGDAVAIGLAVETALAKRLGLAEDSVPEQVRGTLERLGRPTKVNKKWSRSGLIRAMQHDKKVRGGTIRFALPRAIGAMTREGDQWTVPVEPEIVRIVLA